MIFKSSYRLRGFEQNNPGEIERMNLMYYHPQVMEAKGYLKYERHLLAKADLLESDESMFSIGPTMTRVQRDISYAVVDTKNKLVGWIWFYHDKRYPLPRAIAKRLGLREHNSRVYQVSYEKLMSDGWPQVLQDKLRHIDQVELHTPRKGVIVEGLKLAIGKLRWQYRRLYTEKRKLVLYAFVLEENIASQRVLSRNGFAKEARQYSYGKICHDLWVKVI